MPAWSLFVFLGGGLAVLFGQSIARKKQEVAAGKASGLVPVSGLSHLPESLQRSALWTLSDGGFEGRVIHGVIVRQKHDVDVTAFDMETLRQRRGEWAWLPVDKPFRIGPTVSIVACETDLVFPHVLLKKDGTGDDLEDDNRIERTLHIAKRARDTFGLARSYAAELPKTLPAERLAVDMPDGWRAYGKDKDAFAALLTAGFRKTLEQAGRRDLVVELIETLIIVYPATLAVVGPDALADLTSTALALTDGLLAASPPLSPRGVEAIRPEPT